MKALVVRFTAIGDCVMAVPVAASIRARYPDSHITWAVEPYCAPVIDTHRLVNDVVLFPRDKWEQRRWSPKTWADQIKTFASMRKRSFDIGIDLQGHAKTALCLRIANPKKRIAAAGHDFLSRKLNPTVEAATNEQHTVEYSLSILSQLGDFPKDVRFVMPELSEERARISDRLSNRSPLATISISAGRPRKMYPSDKWVEVARLLEARGFQVAFLGGPTDSAAPHPEAMDWVGKLPLRETMAAVTLSAVHLAADTGTGHIAAAYNIPVVSIFGQSQVSKYRPFTSNGVVLDGQGLVANVTTEQVLQAVNSLLARQSAKISH